MDLGEKLETLCQDAQFEVSARATADRWTPGDLRRWITPTALPGGRIEPHFRVLLSNTCEKDCAYCANRCGRDFERVYFQPEELARAFHQMWRRGLVTGLFLSSAVHGNSALTMERMIAAIEILRNQYDYHSYVHLKLMPGVDQSTVARAVQLADRVSVNLEAPNPERLARLTGKKSFYDELLTPLRWVSEMRNSNNESLLPLGHTTQLVVGASDETDTEVLTTAHALYRDLGLARVYYSAFRPIENTPLENHPPTPPLRQHRLYQSDLLLRGYGFVPEELVFDRQGNLPLETDPKILVALQQPHRFPVEINTAPRSELIRVPGIGPRSASRIVKRRGQSAFRSLEQLKKVGASAKRAAPFILLDGRRPPFQPSLL